MRVFAILQENSLTYFFFNVTLTSIPASFAHRFGFFSCFKWNEEGISVLSHLFSETHLGVIVCFPLTNVYTIVPTKTKKEVLQDTKIVRGTRNFL